MKPLTRRQLIMLGAVGAGLTTVGGVGVLRLAFPSEEQWTTQEPRPPEVAASAGLLEVELEAAAATVQIGDRSANLQVFNGSLPGPTLRLRPGDTLRVRLRNSLAEPTNLHVHGLQVSPRGNGDNPFISIAPGESFDYEYKLPPDHPSGTYWYHPHHHGHVADQVSAGLYGAIVVEEDEPLPVSRERILIISDLSLDASGDLAGVSPMERMTGREGELVLVNGQVNPRFEAAPGERERWRIINACPARFVRLTLPGQRMLLLGTDIGRLPEAVAVTELDVLPGGRADVLVETSAGTSTLVASPVDRGADTMMGGGNRDSAPAGLLTLDVTGEQSDALAPVPSGPVLADLRDRDVAGRRTIELAMGGMGGGGGMGAMMSFTINGQEFDHERLDTSVATGSVEEWTLVNSSTMDHPLHLHVWPMQVVEDPSGQEVAEPDRRDVVNIPAASQVKVLVAFDDFTGRTVYHCHILDHEDLGMMASIEAT